MVVKCEMPAHVQGWVKYGYSARVLLETVTV
jgi:hypothetical protein